MTKNIVVYHGPTCLDGLMSAAVALKKFSSDVEFVVGKYQEEPDYELFNNKCVFILDFSYPKEVMNKICGLAKHVFWLDHHKSAQQELKDFIPSSGKFYSYFDESKSGAVISWNFFFAIQEVPEILLRVQDRDLWKWEYPDTAAVTAALYSYPAEVEVMCNFLSAGKTQLDQLRHEGRALLRARQKEIDLVIKTSVKLIDLDGCTVPIVNCSPSITSEVGNELAKEYPFAVMWHDFSHYRSFSLRSSADNLRHVDVSEIAKEFGGGGHKHAAGFKVKKEQYTWSF